MMKKSKKQLKLISSTSYLTPRQERLIRSQIRKDSCVVDFLIERIDLLINREKCPKDANTLLRFRKRLSIAMAENDNFRKVLWRHQKVRAVWRVMPTEIPDPLTYLLGRIKLRQQAAIASACMK